MNFNFSNYSLSWIAKKISFTSWKTPVFVELADCKNFESIFEDNERVVPQELLKLGLESLKYRRSLGQKAVNLMNLSLSQIRVNGSKTSLFFQPVSYASTIGTHGNLDTKLSDGLTVREKYGGIESMLSINGFNKSLFSKMVGVSVIVVSADNKVLLTQRSPKVAVEPNSFHVTIPEGMSREDIDSKGSISPVAAVLRGVSEELSDPDNKKKLRAKESDVKILGLGISTKYLQPEFAALVKMPHKASEIIYGAEKARDRWERKKIIAYDFSAEELLPLLIAEKWSPHGLYSLYTALKWEKLI